MYVQQLVTLSVNNMIVDAQVVTYSPVRFVNSLALGDLDVILKNAIFHLVSLMGIFRSLYENTYMMNAMGPY